MYSLLLLGLSAAYLVNKNLQMKQRVEEQVEQYQQESDPDGEFSEMRAIQARVPDADRYTDINVVDLPRKDVDELVSLRDAKEAEVASYESAPLTIQGVYLNYD